MHVYWRVLRVERCKLPIPVSLARSRHSARILDDLSGDRRRETDYRYPPTAEIFLISTTNICEKSYLHVNNFLNHFSRGFLFLIDSSLSHKKHTVDTLYREEVKDFR